MTAGPSDPGRARSRPIVYMILIAAFTEATTKLRPASTITRSMLHSTDGDQNLLVRYPSGLVWPMKPAIPCRPRANASAQTTSK